MMDRFRSSWGMVFPLGMYSAGTYQLAKAAGFSFLVPLSQCFYYLALAAWLFTFGGLIRRMASLMLGAGHEKYPRNYH